MASCGGWVGRRGANSIDFYSASRYSSGSLALQDDPYTPSTHTSLESPRNGGINGYFTFEHGLLQGEPSIITSKWGLWHRKGGFITQDTHIIIIILYYIICMYVLTARTGEAHRPSQVHDRVQRVDAVVALHVAIAEPLGLMAWRDG